MKKLAAGFVLMLVMHVNVACRRESDSGTSVSGEPRPSSETQGVERKADPVFPDSENVRARLAERPVAASQDARPPQAAGRRQRMPMIQKGEQARVFEAQTLDDKRIHLDQYKGKTVLLNFWASWCGPCRNEMPFVKRLAETYSDTSDFAIIGISLDRSERAMKDFVNRQNMDWPNIFDGAGGQIASLYGVAGIPFNLLIGPDGKVIATGLRGQGMLREVEAGLQRNPSN